jgi:hypothetical protein
VDTVSEVRWKLLLIVLLLKPSLFFNEKSVCALIRIFLMHHHDTIQQAPDLNRRMKFMKLNFFLGKATLFILLIETLPCVHSDDDSDE